MPRFFHGISSRVTQGDVDLSRASIQLQRLGVSPEGARQFLAGEVITNLGDRHRLARIMEGRTESVGKDETITVGGGRTESLRQSGISATGARQFFAGMPVGDAPDRRFLSALYNDLFDRPLDPGGGGGS
ncbi:MAG: hypothetical protein ACRD68_00440 [Pyrinomonadaceae bacterium]